MIASGNAVVEIGEWSGLELDRHGVIGHGAVQVLLGVPGDAAKEKGIGIFRVSLDRLAVVGDGAVEVVFFGTRQSREFLP